MVAHVLVGQATLDVDILVVWLQLQHLGELLKCLMELLDAAVHQAQVENGRGEVLLVLQRVLKEKNRTVYFIGFILVIRLLLLRLQLSFSLIGEAFGMIKLSILIFQLDGQLEICMRLIKLLFLKFQISAIEIIFGVHFVILYCDFIFN